MGRIFHLLDEGESFSDHAGGAVSRWAANMLRNSSEIIVCPSFDDSWGFPRDRIYVLPKWSWTHPIHPLLYRLPWLLQKAFYKAVFKPLLQKLCPGDLVYVHNRPESAAALASVAERLRFKVVLHMHNSHLVRASRSQKTAMQNIPIAFVSKYLRDELQAAWPEHKGPTAVIYNGADDTIFFPGKPHPHDPPEIIFTGRLVPIKGVHVLVEAMRLLEARGIPAHCTIVGGAGFGSSRKTLYVRKLKSRASPNTSMIGYFSGTAVAALLRKADIYCLPSIWNDPFPLSILEALATGIPVVASGTGGIPEELAWGGGLTVAPNNPEKLADTLQLLVSDPQLRAKMSAIALRAFKDHFQWSTVRKDYEDFMQLLGFPTPELQNPSAG